MSAVYGYTMQGKPEPKSIDSLRRQNLRYGGTAVKEKVLEEQSVSGRPQRVSALGCCVKNLSASERNGVPVISFHQYQAVMDVLLYNREEMESELDPEDADLKQYHKEFSEMEDGELLFFYVLKKGYHALKGVNGDFAGAIYDTDRKEWTLIRDHNGIRPLFYYLDEEKMVFSTDIRGIIAFPGICLSVNEKKLYDLMMGYNELTLCETDYAEIHCIRPASWTVIDEKLSKTEQVYWKPGSQQIRYQEPRKYAEELRSLIEDSVRRRLNAVSGMIGCEFSGGLDSSVIAILISRSHRNCSYFSWSLSPEDRPLREGDDERKVILDICKSEGITCEFAENRQDKDPETIDQTLQKLQVPYLNTLYLSEGSRWVKQNGANVMFTGHGGDEGVSHRCNFYELWYRKEYAAFFRAVWNSTSVKNIRLLRFIYRIFHQFFVVHPHFKGEYRNRRNMESFLTDCFKDQMKETEHLPLTFAYDPVIYILSGGQRVRIDNAAVQGAENGVQYIFPYLDYRVLDYAVSIPRSCFQNGFTNRAVFREAFQDLMPESLKAVHYKDEASFRDYIPSPEEIEKASKALFDDQRELLEYLDSKLWGPYLDFAKLRQAVSVMAATEEEVNFSSRILEGLLYCARIQNLMEQLSG